MIYDCFMFFNENDALAIRLEELYPVVDCFVIVVGNKTFRGKKKPNYYDHERFQKYQDKVRMVYYGDEIEINAWDRESRQRNAIADGLHDAKAEDIIIISDCDEIPRRSIIKSIEPVEIVSLMLDVYCAGVNYLTPNRHTVKVCRYKDLTTAQDVRTTPNKQIIEKAGWEFSSLTTPEGISQKLRSFSHDDLDTPAITNPKSIAQRLARHEDPYGWGHHYEVVEIDDTWPEAVKNDREYWSKYEWTK